MYEKKWIGKIFKVHAKSIFSIIDFSLQRLGERFLFPRGAGDVQREEWDYRVDLQAN